MDPLTGLVLSILGSWILGLMAGHLVSMLDNR